jgi:CHAD domain-containing protein
VARQNKRASAGQHLADVLRNELRRYVELLRACDPVNGEVEAVHDARVAIRRIRSTLRTYRPVLDARRAAEVSAELGWLANQLDPVRDVDVRREHLENGLRLLAAGSTPAGEDASAGLLRRLDLERASALAAFVASQESGRRSVVDKCLDELSSSPPVTARAEAPARELVPRLLERPWRDLRATAKSARSASGASELNAMHIRAKQLRYSAELASPLFGPTLRQVARACAKLQGTLGDHRDALETAEWLTTAAQAPELAFLAGQLFAEEQRHAVAELRALDGDWRQVRRRWRRWQATTLA